MHSKSVSFSRFKINVAVIMMIMCSKGAHLKNYSTCGRGPTNPFSKYDLKYCNYSISSHIPNSRTLVCSIAASVFDANNESYNRE